MFPGLIYNHASIGYTLKTSERIEHNFEIGSYFLYMSGGVTNMRIYYNRNYLKKPKNNIQTYIPFWGGVTKTNLLDENFEDGGPNYDYANMKLGSGYGMKILNNGKDWFRVEIGAGGALYFIDKRQHPSFFDFNNFEVAYNYPILPQFRLNLKYIIPLSKK